MQVLLWRLCLLLVRLIFQTQGQRSRKSFSHAFSWLEQVWREGARFRQRERQGRHVLLTHKGWFLQGLLWHCSQHSLPRCGTIKMLLWLELDLRHLRGRPTSNKDWVKMVRTRSLGINTHRLGDRMALPYWWYEGTVPCLWRLAWSYLLWYQSSKGIPPQKI
jgi:hypothetical protein